MTKSVDLLDLKQVAEYFGVSPSTIRRKVKKSRENGFGFVIPVFSSGSRLIWRRVDIENFRCEDAETIVFNPSVPSSPPVMPVKNHAQVQQELRALGVKLPN